jgi:hypothetical protein
VSPSASLIGRLGRIQRWALLLAVIGIGLCILGAIFNQQQFFRSFLVGWLFWTGVSLGALAIVMLHNLTGGAWGLATRQLFEAAAGLIALMALLAAPFYFGMRDLYIWAQPEAVRSDVLLQDKQRYLNELAFFVRSGGYFLVWIASAMLLNRMANRWRASGDLAIERRQRQLSGPGLVLLVLTVTFAAVDWTMSLEPHWYSATYGVLVMVGHALSGLALVIVVFALLARDEWFTDVVTIDQFHDLGKLLLAFTMLWAYIAFSQFLIIWMGNLAEEAPWYLRRTAGGWEWIALVVVAFHFVAPFLLLLSRDRKRNPRALGLIAALLVAMRMIDLFWLVAPAFHERLVVHWLDFAAPVAVGGIWVAAFTWRLKRQPIWPMRPLLREEFAHG